jgi:hypothetical protein
MSDAQSYRRMADECRRNAEMAAREIDRRLAAAFAKDFEEKAIAAESAAALTGAAKT